MIQRADVVEESEEGEVGPEVVVSTRTYRVSESVRRRQRRNVCVCLHIAGLDGR